MLRSRFDTFVTFRDASGLWTRNPVYAGVNPTCTISDVDALDFYSMARAPVKRYRKDRDHLLVFLHGVTVPAHNNDDGARLAVFRRASQGHGRLSL
jgi:hypothetical protein